MKKILLALVTAVFALGFMSHGAEAAKKKKTEVVVTPSGVGDGTARLGSGPVRGPSAIRGSPLRTSGSAPARPVLISACMTAIVVGVHTGTHTRAFAYGASAIGCAALSPIVGTLIVNRPLTTREVFISTANCAVPFVGGWVMNAWFDRNGWK